MCGRVTLDFDIALLKEILEEAFDVKHMTIDSHEQRYNIAPGQQILSVINDGQENRAGFLNWGFIPAYAKSEKDGYKLINSRSETIDTKPTFKKSFLNKRCLILADSFYEWHKDSPDKTPYRIQLRDQPIMAMAGIWSKYVTKENNVIFSCSIVTTEANDMMKRIHHRMPVLLDQEERKIWLAKDNHNVSQLKSIMTPYASNQMRMYPVTKLVNNVRIDSVECIEAL